MLFALADHNTLYRAMLTDDRSYEGRVYVAVRSTGVFCRIVCSSRRPKSDDCQFFETIGQCLKAGYRPCQHCRPMLPDDEPDPVIQILLQKLETNRQRRWREQDVCALGLDPSLVRRSFKRRFGLTFMELARLTRLREGFLAIEDDRQAIDPNNGAGSAPDSLRVLFAKLLDVEPSTLKEDTVLRADRFTSELGDMIVVSDETSLHLLDFADRRSLSGELKKLFKFFQGSIGIGRFAPTDHAELQLKDYFAGNSVRFSVPVTLHGTPFSQRVWRTLQTIPAGRTWSYQDLANAIGQPASTRAVARANGANQLAIIVPCHRVIGADGSLTGYGGGLWRKRILIDLERRYRG